MAKTKTFQNERIVLDGATYDGCTFERCELVFLGAAATTLTNNQMIGLGAQGPHGPSSE